MQNPKPEDVEQFVAQSGSPFVTTGDVAEEFPSVTARTIRKRLNSLVNDGAIEKREVGANSIVWYVED